MSWGKNVRLSIFGESHGSAVGVVIEGMRPGIRLDLERVARFMKRRAPGGAYATQRREQDAFTILSGVYNGYTQGTPIAAMIGNTDVKSADYEALRSKPRPGHADLGAFYKYKGYADLRGGGHFSGRLTAPLVFAGALAMQALENEGVVTASRLYSAGGVFDAPMEHTRENAGLLEKKEFPVYGEAAEAAMKRAIEDAREAGDSIGGVAEVFALGVGKGLGGPLFAGAEGTIAQALFAIPGVKGVEFGDGFSLAQKKGSEVNDALEVKDGEALLCTNHCGGILGGVTVGAPLWARAAFKPTPSIAAEQQTVDLEAMAGSRIRVAGRHDPCIALRGVAAAQAAFALALLELYGEA